MLPIDQLTEDVLFERYDSLPDKLADALDSPANVEAVKKACIDHRLVDEEKMLMVTQLATFVILGFLHPDDLGAEINAALELENPKLSASIAADIKNKVFTPIKNDIEANYYPLTSDDSREKDAPMILAAIGETSAPPKLPPQPFVPVAPPPTPSAPIPLPVAPSPAKPPLPMTPPVVNRIEPPVVSPSMPLGTSGVEPPVVSGAEPRAPELPKISSSIKDLVAGAGKMIVPLPPPPSTPLRTSPSAPKPSVPTPQIKLPVPTPTLSPAPALSIKPDIPSSSAPFAPKPASPTGGTAPLPMMMHENLSARPIGQSSELHMDFSQQNITSSMNVPRPQGVPPRPAQLELGGAEEKAAPQTARTTPKIPRVVNYSASRPDVAPGSPFAEPPASPFSKPAPPEVSTGSTLLATTVLPSSSQNTAGTISPPKTSSPSSAPLYKPFGGTSLPPQATFSPPLPPVVSRVEPPSPIGATPSDATVRHEEFVDLTHLDKK